MMKKTEMMIGGGAALMAGMIALGVWYCKTQKKPKLDISSLCNME